MQSFSAIHLFTANSIAIPGRGTILPNSSKMGLGGTIIQTRKENNDTLYSVGAVSSAGYNYCTHSGTDAAKISGITVSFI